MENGLCPPKLFQFLSLEFDDDCRRTGCELALICSHEQTDGSPISYLSQFARKQIHSPHPTLKFSKFQFCPKYENSKLIPSTNPSIMNLLLPSSSSVSSDLQSPTLLALLPLEKSISPNDRTKYHRVQTRGR